MSLLSYEEIKECLEKGYITNALEENINASSLDVRLGSFIMIEEPNTEEKYRYNEVSYRDRNRVRYRKMEIPSSGFVLYPGQFILAETKEMFFLPNFISAEFRLKSSLARIGLNHSLAAWIDAGFNNSVLTLELKNITQFHAIRLFEGDKIGQIIFFSHKEVPEEHSYRTKGNFNNSLSVRAI